MHNRGIACSISIAILRTLDRTIVMDVYGGLQQRDLHVHPWLPWRRWLMPLTTMLYPARSNAHPSMHNTGYVEGAEGGTTGVNGEDG